MDDAERQEKYDNPGTPKKGKGKFKKFHPTVHADGTGPQRRRIKHKHNRAIAAQVAVAQAKVDRLRGAAKKSAQKTLDTLKGLFK